LGFLSPFNRNDFTESLILNVLREAIFGDQIGAGEETVHGGCHPGHSLDP
jgi:hypothetical protein